MARGFLLGKPGTGGGGHGGYSSYDLALDFKNGIYRSQNTLVSSVSSLPGYSYARTGAKYELDANGLPLLFAANTPAIVPGVGYWARQALTNLVVWSNTTSNAGWVVAAGSKAAGQADPVTGSDAMLYTADGTNAGHTVQPPGVNFVSGTVYTLSAFVKAGTQSIVQLACFSGTFGVNVYGNFTLTGAGAVNTVGSSVTASGIQAVGGGWYRIWITAPATGTLAQGFGLYAVTSGSAARTEINTLATTFYATGAQVVAGSLPGPAIITGAATATIALDDMRLTQPIPLDEDWIMYCTLAFQAGTDGADMRPFVFSDGTVSNRLSLSRSGANAPSLVPVSAGSTQGAGSTGISNITTAGRSVILARRAASKYSVASKNFAGVVQVAPLPAATGLFPVGLNRIDIGSQLGGNFANAPIEFIGYKRGTFSDADLTALLAAA